MKSLLGFLEVYRHDAIDFLIFIKPEDVQEGLLLKLTAGPPRRLKSETKVTYKIYFQLYFVNVRHVTKIAVSTSQLIKKPTSQITPTPTFILKVKLINIKLVQGELDTSRKLPEKAFKRLIGAKVWSRPIRTCKTNRKRGR